MPHPWTGPQTDDDASDRAAGTYATECPACDSDALLVSADTVPRSGPLPLDGYEIHEVDGAAYYHS